MIHEPINDSMRDLLTLARGWIQFRLFKFEWCRGTSRRKHRKNKRRKLVACSLWSEAYIRGILCFERCICLRHQKQSHFIVFSFRFVFVRAEEIVTKKKTELTTTKQIETRVKRQVVLEDGKVVQDSGPIVETNTTEDTDKQESESVEVSSHLVRASWHPSFGKHFLVFVLQRRNLGGDEVDGPKPLEQFPSNGPDRALTELPENDKNAHTVLAPRADGLVRESKTQKVVSHEEIQERTVVDDVKHLGDFSDEVSDSFCSQQIAIISFII